MFKRFVGSCSLAAGVSNNRSKCISTRLDFIFCIDRLLAKSEQSTACTRHRMHSEIIIYCYFLYRDRQDTGRRSRNYNR